MVYAQQIWEQEAPEPKIELSLEAQVFLSFKHKTPNRYKLLDTMIRANIELDQQLTDKTIYLSEKAKKIFKTVILKLLRGETVTLNHKYLSKATLCKSDQNWNILKELFKIFDINYHRLFKLNGRFIERTYHVQLHPTIIRELRDAELSNSEFYPEFFRRTNTNRDNFNKVKDIDLESNFLQNSESKKVKEISNHEPMQFPKIPLRIKTRLPNQRKKPTNSEIKAKVYRPFTYAKPKTLADMYPLLDQSICDELRSKSIREFSDNFIAQRVLTMSKKPTIMVTFECRRGFIAYMVKVLQGELHDPVKTSNINFRLRANLMTTSNTYQKQEIKVEDLKLPEGIWGDISQKLIAEYDIYVYKNWFSKLNPMIDETKENIMLKASSKFAKDWIISNYDHSLQRIISNLGINFLGVN